MTQDERRLAVLLARLRDQAKVEALGEIYDLAAPRVYGWAHARELDNTAAERIVKDTFVALWRGSCHYRGIRPWAWIAIHAVRAARNGPPLPASAPLG